MIKNYVYWLMLFVAAIAAVLINLLRREKYFCSKTLSIIMTVILILYGCIGAKILYVLENPLREFSISNGMSFFGTVFFVPLAMGLTSIVIKKDVLTCADFYSPAVPLILAFMRIGCYFSGCCGGREFSFGTIAFKPPAQLIECFFDIIIFIILLKIDSKEHPKGILYPLFMIMYSFVRFFIEFIRSNERVLLCFTQGQILSFAAFLLGALTFIILKRRYSHEKR